MKGTLALTLMIAIVAGASAQNVQDYRYFKNEGIFDPGVSDATASMLVRKGIASADPVILDLTIRALGGYAMHVINDLPTPYGSPRERSFSDVPELKMFLIAHWREQHQRSGNNMLGAMQLGLGVEGTEGFDGVTVEGLGLPEDASPDDILDAAAARTPAWLMVLNVLCALYPGDGDVLELVWEVNNTDVSPNMTLGTLRVLNIGRFATPEANAFRIDRLTTPRGDHSDPTAVAFAVEGLALSRPLEAIPHLISAALEHRSARGKILIVLAGYDDDALKPFASDVASLLAQTNVRRPMGAVFEAASRLGEFSRQRVGEKPQ